MKFYHEPGRLIRSIMICFFLSAQPAVAQSSWTNLFNGNNLSGWKQLNGKARFEAKGGEIVGHSVPDSINSFLATDKEYGDFILELEFKVDDRMNSGVQVRSESTKEYKNGKVHGYQVEIDPSDRAWTGGLYDEGRRDWLYPLEYNPKAKLAFRKDDWNKMRVECIGSAIRAWINGVATSHVVDNLTSKGFIALQVHAVNKSDVGRQVHWRNIRIQTVELKPSPPDEIFIFNLLPNNLSEAEKSNGVTLLWDGKTSEGWRGANLDIFPDKGWDLTGGEFRMLPLDASLHGIDVITKEEYGGFDLQFEFKFEDGANSGLKYFVKEKPDHSAAVVGLEYQILDNEHHPDAKMGVDGNRTLAALYDLIAPRKEQRGVHKTGEWNQGRIISFPDKKVEQWLNGYKVVEYQRGSPEYLALVAKSKYKTFENFGVAEKGHILLQYHGGGVSFRSIKIKPLK